MIKYVTVAKKNPITKAVKYYANIAPTTPMNLSQVAEEIEKICAMTSADVKAILDALQYVVRKSLLNGNAVRLGDLGSFRPTIKSKGSDTKEEVKAESIERVRCRFTPSGTLASDLQKAKFGKYGATEDTITDGN